MHCDLHRAFTRIETPRQSGLRRAAPCRRQSILEHVKL
jgi:hypothetical protein